MVYLVCQILLSGALAMAAYRLFRGPTAADRILAIDLLAVITAASILLHAVTNGRPVFLDVVVVLGIIVFFGTVALARTLSREP